MGKVVAKKKRQTEDQLQRQCVAWFRNQYPDKLLHHISVPVRGNNAIQNRNFISSQKAKGVLFSMPDLFIFEESVGGHFKGLAIELKTPETHPFKWRPRMQSIFGEKGCYNYQIQDDEGKGKHQRDQIKMLNELGQRDISATFAWDFEGFQDVVNSYFGKKKVMWNSYAFRMKRKYIGGTLDVPIPILQKYIP